MLFFLGWVSLTTSQRTKYLKAFRAFCSPRAFKSRLLKERYTGTQNNRTSTLALLPVTRTIGVFPTGAQVLPTVGVNRTTDSSSKKSRARCLLARRLIRGHSVAIH